MYKDIEIILEREKTCVIGDQICREKNEGERCYYESTIAISVEGITRTVKIVHFLE